MMQVWMPMLLPKWSVQNLDNKRLNAQVHEAHLALRCARGELSGGYANHPVGRAFARRVSWLKRYYNFAIREWRDRGFKSTRGYEPGASLDPKPWFVGEPWYHQSHEAVLQWKLPEHYGPWVPAEALRSYTRILELLGVERPVHVYPCGIGCYWRQDAGRFQVSMNTADLPGWALNIRPRREHGTWVHYHRSWRTARLLDVGDRKLRRRVLFFQFPEDQRFVRAIPRCWEGTEGSENLAPAVKEVRRGRTRTDR